MKQSMTHGNSYKNLNKVIGKADIWVCWIKQKPKQGLHWNRHCSMQKQTKIWTNLMLKQTMICGNSYKNLNKVIGKVDIWVCWIRQKFEQGLHWNRQCSMQKQTKNWTNLMLKQTMTCGSSYKNLNKVIGKVDIWVCWIGQKFEQGLCKKRQWSVQKQTKNWTKSMLKQSMTCGNSYKNLN